MTHRLMIRDILARTEDVCIHMNAISSWMVGDALMVDIQYHGKHVSFSIARVRQARAMVDWH